MNWQLLIVLLCVVAAALYLASRIKRPRKNEAPRAFHCPNCGECPDPGKTVCEYKPSKINVS